MIQEFLNLTGELLHIAQNEGVRFWRKPIARFVLVLMAVGPIAGEALLAMISPSDAAFPQVTQFLFSADLLIFLALITVVLSVMSLGNDYEVGTVSTLLTRGMRRYEFILSKMLVSVSAAFVNVFTFMAAGLAATAVVHTQVSDVPFFEAAGSDIIWRSLGGVGVAVLFNAVLSGIVLLALVIGRSTWAGMLAGLGYFTADFAVGVFGAGELFGVEKAYSYALTYYGISLYERFFPSDPNLSLPRSWGVMGSAGAGEALLVLGVASLGLLVAALVVFERQDIHH